MISALVVGYGSIGKRHTDILKRLGIDVAVYSKRIVEVEKSYNSLQTAVEEHKPNYIVIANETSLHLETLEALNEFSGKILIEKPVFSRYVNIDHEKKDSLFVAYNLRFHPILIKLKELLNTHKIISFHIYVGQYLPTWRPGTDYRKSYSASKKKGGGVLRDLSHELDYALWLCGDWKSVVALGGHFSDLEIDSEDIFNITMTTELCPLVNIQMNYLDRRPRREIIINTDKATINVDLINGTLEIDNEKVESKIERDYTYKMQHLAILNNEFDIICAFDEGLNVLKLIESVEESALKRKWITNG